MKIDNTLHPLAKTIIDMSQNKNDMYRLICSIDEWYLRQIDSWMDWIRTKDADKDTILRYMDSIALSLRLQVSEDINLDWSEAWDKCNEEKRLK